MNDMTHDIDIINNINAHNGVVMTPKSVAAASNLHCFHYNVVGGTLNKCCACSRITNTPTLCPECFEKKMID